MQTPSSTPPGWYPDPSGAPGRRYWDGFKWNMEATGGGQDATPVSLFALDPIVLGVEESYEVPQEFFEGFTLSRKVRDQLFSILGSNSTDQVEGISEAILTAVMTLESQLVNELHRHNNNLANLGIRIIEVQTRLYELEERIYRAGVKLPAPVRPRLGPLNLD